jgi:hypothetical protein
MGKMVKRTYIGAFIEVKNENFQKLWLEHEFYEAIVEDRFMTAERLETINVLIPKKSDKYAEMITSGEGNEVDFIVTAFDGEGRLKDFKKDFAEIIVEVQKTFPDIELKYGLISF